MVFPLMSVNLALQFFYIKPVNSLGIPIHIATISRYNTSNAPESESSKINTTSRTDVK